QRGHFMRSPRQKIRRAVDGCHLKGSGVTKKVSLPVPERIADCEVRIVATKNRAVALAIASVMISGCELGPGDSLGSRGDYEVGGGGPSHFQASSIITGGLAGSCLRRPIIDCLCATLRASISAVRCPPP